MPKMTQALISHAQGFIAGGGSSGKLLAMNGMNVGVLRTNDLLRKEEWQELDEVLVGVQRQRLIGIGDLVARGLSFPLAGGLGTLLSQYERLGDMSAANVDFNAATEGEKDSVTFDLISVPVPIFHKDFSIGIRRQQASAGPNGHGTPIDTTQIETAGQKVTEAMESVLFNGMGQNAANGAGGGLQTGFGNTTQNYLYGYTNQPNINTSAGSDWGTATNPQIDVIAAIAALEADRYYGPYVLYVSPVQFGQLRAFFTDGSGDQVFDRLKRIQGIEDIRPGDQLADGTALLVSMRRDVIDLAIGQPMTVVEWESKGGMINNFKVMAALAPRVKFDAANGSGICLITGI